MKSISVAERAENPSHFNPTQPQRVLVVDADESARSVLSVALSRLGFEILHASSSTEAMRLLSAAHLRPQMVVVASQLSDDDGFSFVAQLRAERDTDEIPVLLMAQPDEEHVNQLSRVVGNDEIVIKPAYARDIATLAYLQLAPAARDGARTLDTEGLPVSHLLRAVLATSRSGVIELEQGRARIAYRRGKVLDASFDSQHGTNALIRAVALARGEYRVVPRSLAFDAAFHFTLKEMVTVVAPRLERWEQLVLRSLPLDAKLAVDFAALARALPSMPDAVNAVVRLFDGLRDVREVLMDSPLDETVTLEVSTRLYLMGVVAAVKPGDRAELARSEPRLFEPRALEAAERMDALFDDTNAPIQVLVETGATETEDWFRDEQGTGLEVSDPSEGWSTTRTVELSPEAEQHLAAFNIQPVVDVEPAPVFAADLAEFSQGEAQDEQPLEEALAAPIRLFDVAATGTHVEQSVRALENEFFSVVESPAQPSISDAVLWSNRGEAHPQGGKSSWLLISLLLVLGTAGAAWLLSAQVGSPSAELEQPAPVVVAAPPVVQPVEPVVAVEPLEPTLAEPIVADADTNSALVEATRLYDSGKLGPALKALEELVTQDPSSTQAWLMLGLTRYDSGNATGAEEAANTVIALDPKAARAHLLLATIQLDANHRPEANAEIEKYLTMDPNGPFAGEAKALLKR